MPIIMKVEVQASQANRLINSGNVVMVSCAHQDRSSIITIAWHCPVSFKPPALAIAVGKSRFSAELIQKSGEFVVNIPDWNLFDAMLYCGTRSGRDEDKFAGAKLTPEKAVKLLRAPKIRECIGAIECSLIDRVEVGDHYLFLGEVVYAEVEEELWTDGSWKPETAQLIYHLGGSRFMKPGPVSEVS
uniref:Flavin reductase family protein n=1 Tax=candidate division WOR-3 bacterium TaxID=2052148 RepID=A0A7C1NBX7_UNCW3